MLASKPAPALAAEARGSKPGYLVPVAAATSVCAAGALYIGNPRLWGSWHGFLHAAIATRFSHAAFPPENPFFAGEPLPYYWVYHFAGYWLARLLKLDLLHTFHALSWISLAGFVLFAGLIGRTCFRSNRAGIAIACLGLAGANPLGPAIAEGKHLARGVPVVREWPGTVETTFVSNQTADDLMTQPLLGAMYIGGDWRQGQNVVWFFDVGSRAPALAGLMLLLYVMLKPHPGWSRYAAAAVVSCLVTAFNPLVGLAAAGTLAIAALVTRRPARRIGFSAACLAGALAAAPTYGQIFFRATGPQAMLHPSVVLPGAVVLANFLVLVPLALTGARRDGWRMGAVVIAAALLLVATIAIHLPEGNEHNLSNTAQCLLAVPAGAAFAGNRRAFWGLLAVVAPVTAGTLFAFSARPPMPIASSGRELARALDATGLQQLYEWIRRDTSGDSIFVIDPETPVKMSGNVSELPAFTGRTLFTDTPSYLTTPNRDAAFRTELAVQAIEGRPLNAPQREYLARLGRPVYVTIYRAGDREQMIRLTALYGAPMFEKGIAAVFRFRP